MDYKVLVWDRRSGPEQVTARVRHQGTRSVVFLGRGRVRCRPKKKVSLQHFDTAALTFRSKRQHGLAFDYWWPSAQTLFPEPSLDLLTYFHLPFLLLYSTVTTANFP